MNHLNDILEGIDDYVRGRASMYQTIHGVKTGAEAAILVKADIIANPISTAVERKRRTGVSKAHQGRLVRDF
jgi:hypothetical protein